MKNLSHITNKVFGQPWLITPLVHRSIQTQLGNILSGKVQMPDFEDEDEDEEEIKDEQPVISNEVAFIQVEGVIGKHLSMLETMCGGYDVDELAAQLREVRDNPSIQSALIYFNTPGGTVTGVKEVAQLIKEVSAIKHIIGYTDTLCASAGMWLASQCSYFYCSPSADVGSIGVYSIYFDESAALTMEGIKVNAISAGKYKLTGASFQPMTDEEKAMLQAYFDKIYTDFKSAVTTVRPLADEDMQGQCFDGETAYVKGLVDGNINSLDEMINLMTLTTNSKV